MNMNMVVGPMARGVVACCAAFVALFTNAAEVRDVKAVGHYPWNGKVDVTYTVQGVEAGSEYAVSAFVRAGGKDYPAHEATVTKDDTYTFTWDATAAGFRGRVEDAKVIFGVAEPNYAIVDLSAGALAERYPVSYCDKVAEPTADAFKTDKLLLKRVGKKYVGVFEVTQKQYGLVMGTNPSYFSEYLDKSVAEKRPVERVSYEALTESSGFFDLLKARTGLPFALPTGAEWEAAARGAMPGDKAYNLGNYYSLTGKVQDNKWLPLMGRYVDLWNGATKVENGNNNPNRYSDETKGTAIVGSHAANDNGLYDIHGNVAEWTADVESNGKHVLRGGSWQDSAEDCAVTAKWAYSGQDVNQLYKAGFRVFGDQTDAAFVHETTAESAAFPLDVDSDNVRQVRVEDKDGTYTFFYTPENGTEIPWVKLTDLPNWYPTKAGDNVATHPTTGETATFRVGALPIDPKAYPATFTYDGELHTIKVPVFAAPTVNYDIVYWCEDTEGQAKESEATPDKIYFKDVKRDVDNGILPYVIWYKVSSPFYTTAKGSQTLTINPREIAAAQVVLGETLTYTGREQTKAVTEVTIKLSSPDKTLTLAEGTDFTIACNKGVDAGKYTATLTGAGNYTGTVAKAWEIVPFDIGQSIGEGGTAKGVRIEFTPEYETPGCYTYNGREQQVKVASVSVTIGGSAQQFDASSFRVISGDKGTEATAKVGKPYVITVQGTRNFLGTATREWTIAQYDITSDGASKIVFSGDTLVYNGEEQTRQVGKVTTPVGEIPLADCTITGNKGVDAGKYTAKAAVTDGASNFKGFVEKSWTIGQKSIAGVVFTATPDEFTYDRNARTPTITADDGTRKHDGKPMIAKDEGVDWTVTGWEDNVEAGEAAKAKIAATANGNYVGTAEKAFVIKPAVISKVEVKPEFKSFVWDGAEKFINMNRMTVTTENGLTLETSEYAAAGETSKTESGKYTVTANPISTNFKNAEPAASGTWTIVPGAPKLTWATVGGATNVTGEAGTIIYGVSDLTVAAIAQCKGEELVIELVTDSGSKPEIRDNKFHVTEKTVITAYAKFTAKDGTVLEGAKTVVTLVPGQCADPEIFIAEGTAGYVAKDKFNRNNTEVTIRPTDNVNGKKVGGANPQVIWPAWDKNQGTINYWLLDASTNVIAAVGTNEFVQGGLKVSADTVFVVAQIKDTQYLDSIVVTQQLTRVIAEVATPVITVVTNSASSRTVSIECATPDAKIYFSTNYAFRAEPAAVRPAGPMEIARPQEDRDATVEYTGPFDVSLEKDVAVDIKAIAYVLWEDDANDFKGCSEVADAKDVREWSIGDALDSPDQVFTNGWSQLLVPQVAEPRPGVETDWGHPDKGWKVVRDDPTAVGNECMRSGELKDSNFRTSSMTTEVEGPGMIVFNWKANCEDDPTGEAWDHGEFIIDGVVTQKIDGVTGWVTVTNLVRNSGKHALTWTYVKDFAKHGEGIVEGEDCIFLDNFWFVKAPDFGEVAITVDPLVFNKEAQAPVKEDGTNYIHVVVTNPVTGEACELVEGDDYTVECNAQTAAGTYEGLKLQATEGSFFVTGTTNVSWTILPLDLATGEVTLDQTSFTFDGVGKTVNVTELKARHYRDGIISVFDVGQAWDPASDTQSAAGTYTFTVTGSQNLTNSVSTTWTIGQKQLTKDMVKLDKTTYYYNRKGQAPKVTVKAKAPATITADEYSVSYLNKADYSTDVTNAGTKVAIVTAKSGSNWSGAITNDYSIWRAVIDTLTLDGATEMTYTGGDCTVDGTAKMAKGGRPKMDLLPSEWQITGNCAVDAGTYTASVAIVDTKNFKFPDEGAPTAAWKILPLDIANATVTLDPATYSFEYDGAPHKVTKGTGANQIKEVKANGLDVGDAFTVDCQEKSDVGSDYTFSVSASAKNFTGTKGGFPWSITERSLTNATITLTTNLVWNGVTVITNEGTKLVRHIITNATEQTMTFTVRDEAIAKDLVLGVDYVIDNVHTNAGTDAGRYTLQINGLGNYAISTATDWVIAPSLVTITPNVRNPGTNDVLYAKKGDRVAMEVDDARWGKPWLRRTTFNDDGTVKKQSSWNPFRGFSVSERTLVEAFAVTPDCVTGAVRAVDYRFGFDAAPVICFADTNNVPCLYEDGTPWTNGVGHVISNFCHNGQLVALTRGNVVVSNLADGVRQAFTNDAANKIYTDGVLRYTLDGSDPTTNSPVWTADSRIAISNTTLVIAKVFGGQYVDSPTVTNLFIRDFERYAPPKVEYVDQAGDPSAWLMAVDNQTVPFNTVGQRARLVDTNLVGGTIYFMTNSVVTNVWTGGEFAFDRTTTLTAWIGDAYDVHDYSDSETVTVCFDRDQVLATPVIAFTNDDALVAFQDGNAFSNAHQKVMIYRENLVGTKYTDGYLVYTTNDWETTETYGGAFEIWDTTTVKAKATGGVYGYRESDTNEVTFAKNMKALDGLEIIIEPTRTVKQVKVTITNNTGNIVYYTVDGSEPVGFDRTAAKHGTTFSGEGTDFICDIDVGETLVVKAIAYAEVSGGNDYVAVSPKAEESFTREWTIGDTIKPDDPAKQARPDQPDASDLTFENDTTAYDDTNTAWVVDTSYFVATNAHGKGSSMRSGAARAGDSGDPTTVSELSTVVRGPGTITFQWASSTEFDEFDPENIYDCGTFYVDGVAVTNIWGTNGWKTVTYVIEEDGPDAQDHVLTWEYSKDWADDDWQVEQLGIQDCIWVDEFVWTPVPALDHATVVQDRCVYNGAYQTPTFQVTACGRSLTNVVDYVIEATPQMDAGTGYAYTLTANGKTCTGTVSGTWSIEPLSITNAVVTLSGGQMYTRDAGAEVTQYAVVEKITVGGLDVTDAASWTAANTNGISAATYMAEITGDVNLTGSVSTNWVIAPRPIASSMITVPTGIVYSGIETNVTTSAEFAVAYEGDNFGYTVEDGNVATTAGTYRVAIKANAANYTGSATQEWTIAKFDFDQNVAVPVLTAADLVYTGLPQTTDVEKVIAQHPYFGEVAFSNEAWVVSNNVATAAGEYWATLYPLEGNLAGGPISNKWTISQADIEDVVVVLGPTNTYNGKVQRQTIASVTHPTIGALSPNDYEVKNDRKKVAGKFTMTLAGKGNWKGTKSVAWEQLPALIDSITFDPASYVYDGTEKTPAITVKAGELVAAVGTDFTTNGTSSAILAGTNTVTVKGSYDPNQTSVTGNFKVPTDDLTTNVTWIIEPRDVSTLEITQSFTETTYNREEQKPTVTVKYNGKTLPETDYTLDYTGCDCTGAGTVTYKVVGAGNVVGTTNLSYTIKQAVITGFDFKGANKIEYSGKEVSVDAKNVKTANGLVLGKDEWAFADSGTTTWHATEIGDYVASVVSRDPSITVKEGGVAKGWKIYPMDLAGKEVVVTLAKAIAYSAQPQTIEAGDVQGVTVKAGTKLLALAGYTFSCTPQTTVGKYTATVTANDPNFKGLTQVEWELVPRDITGAELTFKDAVWTGSELTAEMTEVKVDGIAFAGTESTFAYQNNRQTDAGRYEVAVTGSDNFTGTATGAWDVKPTAPTIKPGAGGKYSKIAPYITVSVEGAQEDWTLEYMTNGVDWISYPVKGGKFDIVRRMTVKARALSNDGKVYSDVATMEYYFGENIDPTVALYAADTNAIPTDAEVRGAGKLVWDAGEDEAYANFYHSAARVNLTRFGTMSAEEIVTATNETTYLVGDVPTCPYTDGEIWYTVALGDAAAVAPTNFDDGVSKKFDAADAATWPTFSTNATVVAQVFGKNLENGKPVTNTFCRLWTKMPAPTMAATQPVFQFTNTVTLTTNDYVGVDATVTNGMQKIFYTLDGTVPTKDSTLYTGPIDLTWADCDADGKVSVQAIAWYGDDYLASDVVSNEYTHFTAQFPMPTMTPTATFSHTNDGIRVCITNNAPQWVGGELMYSADGGANWVNCGDAGYAEFTVSQTATVLAYVLAGADAHDYTTSATNTATYTYSPYKMVKPMVGPITPTTFDEPDFQVSIGRPFPLAGTEDEEHIYNGTVSYSTDGGTTWEIVPAGNAFKIIYISETTTVMAKHTRDDHIDSDVVSRTYTRIVRKPTIRLVDKDGNDFPVEVTAGATNFYHKAFIEITKPADDTTVFYESAELGKGIYTGLIAVSNSFALTAYAASAATTSTVATAAYVRKWESLGQPTIALKNPDGVMTNVFRHSADTVFVTNLFDYVEHTAEVWPTNAAVKIAVVAGVTNGVPAAADWVAYEEDATRFTDNTNTVWAVVEADDYLPSTNKVGFVRDVDELDMPVIDLDNTVSRTNVVMTFGIPAGANAVYYTYAVTNEDAEVSLADPVGEEYDRSKASSVWTNGSAAVNVAIKPHQKVVAKAIAYFEEDEGLAYLCFTGKSAVTPPASLTLDWTIADGLDVPDWKWFEVKKSAGSAAEIVEDQLVKNVGDSSICYTNVGDNAWLAVTTEVVGPGTVSFDWKTLCEKGPHDFNYDHMTFYLNGTPICKIDGDSGWQTVTHRVNGATSTTNVLKWVYEKDDTERATVGDSAWLDNFRWIPEQTQLAITDELRGWTKGLVGEEVFERDFKDGAGNDNLGKYQEFLTQSAACGRSNWECYVLGLNPEDPSATFVVSAAPEINHFTGAVSITFKPRMAGRTYTLVGKKSLGDAYWTDLAVMDATSTESVEESTITSPAATKEKGYQFFRLRVRMTQGAN